MRNVNGDRKRRIQLLANCLEELASAKHKLLRQLEDLDAQAKAIQVERNQLLNLDAPTSNIPDEVLSLIFEAGMHSDQKSRSHFREDVSHVSHHWRSVALSTPGLWREIRYQSFNILKLFRSFEVSIKRGAVYLARSKLGPVDIYMEITHDHYCSAEFLHSLSNHMVHCRSLCVWASQNILQQLFEAISFQTAPLLTTFRIPSGALRLQTPLLPHGAPRLTTVEVNDVDFSTAPFWLPVFQAVTDLRLTNVRIGDVQAYTLFRDVLTALSSLSHLELVIAEVVSLPDPLPILLPTLQYLHLNFGLGLMFLHHTIKHIYAPSLISVSLAGWGEEAPSTDVSTLTESRFPSLRHIILADWASAALVDIRALAKGLPNIERLTCRVAMHEDLGSHEILKALWDVEEGSEMEDEEHEPAVRVNWPKLHTVAVSEVSEPLEPLALCRTVTALREHGSAIRTLMLPSSCITEVDAQGIRDFIEVEKFIDDWPKPFHRFQ
ncbi:hypothetical protein HWV62_10701 [Athelia sp. TMB]|nr:hypothetical protein HWV62_28706 [Athelia sp. TMB]KAF7974967.1 hypothetical protein HWV62_10701 [Athelia sp. TMB]